MDNKFIVACSEDAKKKLEEAGYRLLKDSGVGVYFFINDDSVKHKLDFCKMACAYTNTLTF